jgi:cytochrome d ubiquinol oxidase subunit II
MLDLSLIWAGIIAFGVLMYVVMDGFDLGIGILFPFFPNQPERDVMMNTVAPVWDGNETWMVLGGAGLFAAFPLVYSAVLSALYLPIILMVIALIFRGVAFEIRFKANRTKHLWDMAFIGGSIATALLQGIILGAYIQGISIVDQRYAGGPFDWLTPFSLFTGLGVLVAYAALGCGWLILKTSRELQNDMYRLMPKLGLALLVIFGIVSLWTPLNNPLIAERWFNMPQFLYFLPVPILVLWSTYGIWHACKKQQQTRPFLYCLFLLGLAFSGFIISLWPMIIPPNISIWDAAAPRSSQAFTLVGAAILIPIILAYTALSYWVFRGKIHVGSDGYH